MEDLTVAGCQLLPFKVGMLRAFSSAATTRSDAPPAAMERTRGGGEGNDWNGFNRREAERAGAGATAPMLWLYGDRDTYYGLPFVRGMFEAFRAAGGRGTLRTYADLPGSGHALMGWQDRWEAEVAALVDDLGDGNDRGNGGEAALR